MSRRQTENTRAAADLIAGLRERDGQPPFVIETGTEIGVEGVHSQVIQLLSEASASGKRFFDTRVRPKVDARIGAMKTQIRQAVFPRRQPIRIGRYRDQHYLVVKSGLAAEACQRVGLNLIRPEVGEAETSYLLASWRVRVDDPSVLRSMSRRGAQEALKEALRELEAMSARQDISHQRVNQRSPEQTQVNVEIAPASEVRDIVVRSQSGPERGG